MKNLLLIVLVIFITSCTQEEVIREVENLSIDASNFQLNLNSFKNLGKEIEIKSDNVSGFLASNFEELLTMEDDLELKIFLGKNKKAFAIYSVDKNKNNSLYFKADLSRFSDSGTICKTCRYEDCVKSALSEAIKEGNTGVDIRIRVKRTLGVRTGIEICYINFSIL